MLESKHQLQKILFQFLRLDYDKEWLNGKYANDIG